MSIGPSSMDRVPLLRKVLTQLRCKNFCINCISWPDLHRVSFINKMVAKAPKHYKTHQNMRLGSNGMERKIRTRLRCTNFCINCTSSAWFAPSFTQQRNVPKYTQTLRNAPEHEFRVQWCWSEGFIAKIPTWLRFTNFYIIAPIRPVLH